MAYVTLHLLNHALGIASFARAEAVLDQLRAFWHSLPGTLLLYGAALATLPAASGQVEQASNVVSVRRRPR